MVEMFWSCTTKEDITAVSSVKAAFQVFSICALGVFMLFMPQKKHSIAIIMNIFIWDLIRDNKTVIWFITCHFLKMHTVLTFIRGIIVSSILPYLFFSLWYPCHLHFGNSGTYSKKISSTVGRWRCTRLFAWLSCQGSGQSRCFPFDFFTIASPLTQSVFY